MTTLASRPPVRCPYRHRQSWPQVWAWLADPRQHGRGSRHSAAHEPCDHERVTAWRDVEQAEPEFARRVRALFDAHRHKTMATLRADGAPRISGIEVSF